MAYFDYRRFPDGIPLDAPDGNTFGLRAPEGSGLEVANLGIIPAPCEGPRCPTFHEYERLQPGFGSGGPGPMVSDALALHSHVKESAKGSQMRKYEVLTRERDVRLPRRATPTRSRPRVCAGRCARRSRDASPRFVSR